MAMGDTCQDIVFPKIDTLPTFSLPGAGPDRWDLIRKLRSGDRIWLVATQPWWAHISCGRFRLQSRGMLSGTQIFGFLAAQALAPNG
jgi:hypothetical protein